PLPTQHQALRMLVNNGVEQTTIALSALVDKRVRLSAPEVTICSLTELGSRLSDILPGEVVTVHQIFNGAMTGDAMLLLEFESANTLIALLTGISPLPGRLGRADQDVLLEVGNILLNTFVGTLSNTMETCVTFTIPDLRLEAVNSLLNTLMIERDKTHHALLVTTQFRIEDGSVEGYLVLVLELSSLEHLITHLTGGESDNPRVH
ncbi:MAG: chemotaxis protein CheC, partial [Anaerolineae bacterium]|nr:chemotaxis protein CheC [Anaerolineae bacterium]